MLKLKELLFPPKCTLCGQTMKGGDGVCPDCLRRVRLNTAPPKVTKGAFYDAAAAGLWYEDDVRRAIHGLKYHEKQSFARPLARIMAYAYEHKLQERADLITFVPTNRATRRKRGYDQAEVLAQELAKLLNLPCRTLLRKTRETQPMHGLRPEARRANVLGAYALTVSAEELAGKTVLLADDILTTGASLSECARMLKMGGCARVLGLCAAAARKNGAPDTKDLEKLS